MEYDELEKACLEERALTEKISGMDKELADYKSKLDSVRSKKNGYLLKKWAPVLHVMDDWENKNIGAAIAFESIHHSAQQEIEDLKKQVARYEAAYKCATRLFEEWEDIADRNHNFYELAKSVGWEFKHTKALDPEPPVLEKMAEEPDPKPPAEEEKPSLLGRIFNMDDGTSICN